MNGKSIIVIGGSGIIGGAAVRRFAGRKGVRVIAASRTPGENLPSGVDPLSVDLSGQADTPFLDVGATHGLYCAFADAPGWKAQQAPNLRLFEGALSLLRKNAGLRHVTLIQGMKAYGSHLGPFRTPARECDPRIPGGHFYDDQLDALASVAVEEGWSWTVLRPHVVIGPALGSPQNLASVLGVYAALKASRGERLEFPGSDAAFSAITQATDAGLLAAAIEWAGEAETAEGEIFNITNGDFYRWRNVWPRIADLFDLEPGIAGGPVPSAQLAGAEDEWRRLAERRGLIEPDLNRLISTTFADYIFGVEWDVMADTQKARRAGFKEFLDSEDMLLNRLSELRELKIIS